MKLFITTLLTLASFNALSADIICGSSKASHKRTYPINAAAIKLASELGLKACSGTSSKRFAAAIKDQKHTGKFVVISASELQAAKDKLNKLGGANGPSF